MERIDRQRADSLKFEQSQKPLNNSYVHVYCSVMQCFFMGYQLKSLNLPVSHKFICILISILSAYLIHTKGKYFVFALHTAEKSDLPITVLYSHQQKLCCLSSPLVTFDVIFTYFQQHNKNLLPQGQTDRQTDRGTRKHEG